MLYHVMCSDTNGVAYACRVRSAELITIPSGFIHEGQKGYRVTYENNKVFVEFLYDIVENPPIISHLAGGYYKVQLTEEQKNARPHLVPAR